MCEGAFSPIAPSIPQVSATDDEIASSAIPPTALSPYYPLSSTSNILLLGSGIKASQVISAKSDNDYESSYPSHFNTGYVLLVFSFAAVRNEIAVDSIASLTTAYS